MKIYVDGDRVLVLRGNYGPLTVINGDSTVSYQFRIEGDQVYGPDEAHEAATPRAAS